MVLSPRQRLKVGLLKVADHINRVCIANDNLAPPDFMQVQYGGGSFFEIGLEFFGILLDHVTLQRDSAVLDVGCGIGRMALPLTAYLTKDGRYEGFDIMPAGIDYCQRHITPRFQNFKFQQADIFNAFYNPGGRQMAEGFEFPFPDNSFDVVFSSSVFTHLAPPAVAQYLRETARVLKPGGRCLHTCFSLDQAALESVAAGRDQPKLRHQLDGFMTSSLENVEDAIGIPAETFAALYEQAGLSDLAIHAGSWARRPGAALAYQDVATATK